MIVLALAVAGGLGAVARLLVDGIARERWGTRLPYGVLLVNATGSLLLGLVVGLVACGGAPDGLRLVVGTGFCGGYTTFSTASVDALRLARQGRPRAAVAYAGGTLLVTLVAGALGLWLGGC